MLQKTFKSFLVRSVLKLLLKTQINLLYYFYIKFSKCLEKKSQRLMIVYNDTLS